MHHKKINFEVDSAKVLTNSVHFTEGHSYHKKVSESRYLYSRVSETAGVDHFFIQILSYVLCFNRYRKSLLR
jgi:hypothetical protein